MRHLALSLLCLTLALNVRAEEPPIAYYDMSRLNQLDLSDTAQAREAWDTAHLVSALQGIVNRDAPRLFVRFMPHPDDFWWNLLRSESEWLHGREVEHIDSIEALLRRFQDAVKGLVAYDERVWATSNLASTIAGVEDRLPLRYSEEPGSLCAQVMSMGLPFAGNVTRLMRDDGGPLFTGEGVIPGTDLPSTGSAKCDAHVWLRHHYLDTGRVSRDYMAFYIDAFWLTNPTESGFSNATLTNHDFFIANKAFFFDLHVWEEEAPVDDPGQKPGTDVETLHGILRAMYEHAGGKIMHIGGFTPWAWKYTNHNQAGSTHGGVDTEWKYAQIISTYNGIMDADALGYSGMANASFYQHHPLEDRYPQNPRPTPESLKDLGFIDADGAVADRFFVCFYMGDYDAAAWFNYHAPLWWQDEAHGETLCTWAFNPNLDRRAPHAMHFVRSRQSANDWFMFGDSGAGYLNPGGLVEPRESGLPSGLDAWVRHNRPYADRYDLDITGFIIDGHSKPMGEEGMDAYLQFSPDGIVGQKIPPRGVHKGVMPYLRMKLDLYGNPGDAGRKIARLCGLNAPKFLFIRTILQSPSWHRDAMAVALEEEPRLAFVDPYTFFMLMKLREAGDAAPPFAADTPATAACAPGEAPQGMRALPYEDGPFELAEVAGRQAFRLTDPERKPFLYFELADDFASPFQTGKTSGATVVVEIHDREAGEIGLQYDSDRSAYREARRQPLTGSGEWASLTFQLPGAIFSHGQNGGADFRLQTHGPPLAVHRVRVTRTE